MRYRLSIFDAAGETTHETFVECYRFEVRGKLQEYAQGKDGEHAQAFDALRGGLAIEGISIRWDREHAERLQAARV